MPNYNVISLSLLQAQNVLSEAGSGAYYKVIQGIDRLNE